LEWAQTSFAERRAVMMEISDYVLAHQDEIMMLSCKDTGKTRMARAYLGCLR
jgi:acyl-CoA reductase-like NAD-dependent aldehyde dehydrogenase